MGIGCWRTMGGVFSYGDAVFLGSAGGNGSRITSLFPVDGGVRYGWVTYDGKLAFSTPYRRGAVTTAEYDLSPVWSLQGEDVDKPGAELHAATLGSGRVDSWIFWPAKWSGALVYQVRNERNGLCLQASGSGVVQAACHANFNYSGAQAFLMFTGAGSNFYLAPSDRAHFSLSMLPGKSRLEISIVAATLWRTLDSTTVTSATTGVQWQTAGGAGSMVTTATPGPQTLPQKWVVAATSASPEATVRFINADSGLCGDMLWSGSDPFLFQSVCQPAVQSQTFRLHSPVDGAPRISPVFTTSMGAAPATNGSVKFTPPAGLGFWI